MILCLYWILMVPSSALSSSEMPWWFRSLGDWKQLGVFRAVADDVTVGESNGQLFHRLRRIVFVHLPRAGCTAALSPGTALVQVLYFSVCVIYIYRDIYVDNIYVRRIYTHIYMYKQCLRYTKEHGIFSVYKYHIYIYHVITYISYIAL